MAGTEKFTCDECGRTVIRIEAPSMPHLCGTCLHMPAWFKDETARRLIDPTHDGIELVERVMILTQKK